MNHRKITLLATSLFYSIISYSQKPTDVPNPSNDSIDLSNPADIIIYIVLPLCAVLFYFIWREKRNKKEN